MVKHTIKCPKCHEVFQVDEAGYAAIVKQIRDKEFSKELKDREVQFEKEKENALQVAKLETEKDYKDKLSEKEKEISELKAKLETEKMSKDSAVKETEAEMDKKISELQNKLDSFSKDKQIEINEIISKKDAELVKKNNEILQLKGEKDLGEKEFQIKEQNLKEKYEVQLRYKDDEIARYKDFKAKLSTKMLGETLEQHCEISFNQLRAIGFSGAYFEKDNDAKSGSKGDYIFRDFDSDGNEYISIMFDMKNEADETATKKKNEDFFKELDKDRKQKNCEYAVLVSMLEPENELYNNGIVDVSHKYEKMYVVRPQFFIPIITLLRNAATNSIQYKRELALVKSQNIDISNFEDEMNNFKEKFIRNVKDAGARFNDAITGIDKAIKTLQGIKDALLLSEKHLNAANNKVEDLSIKRLTRNNATMQAKFEELKKTKRKTKD